MNSTSLKNIKSHLSYLLLVMSMCFIHPLAFAEGTPVPNNTVKAQPMYGYFTDTAHNITITRHSGDELTLKAVGGDPHIMMKFKDHKEVDLTQFPLMEIEYKSPKGVAAFQMLTRAAGSTRHQGTYFMKIPAATEWTTQTILLDTFHKTWPFGKASYMRWELSHGSGPEITIRKLRFRARTTADQALYNAEKIHDEKLIAYNTQVKKYLESKPALTLPDIRVSEESVTINLDGVATTKGLFLLEMLPSTDPVYMRVADKTPLSATPIPPENNNKLRLPRYSTSTYDRVYSKWALAEKKGEFYHLLSAASYATRIESKIKVPEPKQASKKGILLPENLQEFDKVAKMDLDYGCINFVANHGIHYPEEGRKRNIKPVIHMGRKLYLREGIFRRVEATVKFCSANNIVPIIIILFRHNNYFAHPKAMAGNYVLPDFSERDIELDLIAYLDYCVQRFQVPNDPKIPAPYWIVHNEIDAHDLWANAGERYVYDYMQEYMKSFRIIYNATRKNVSYGKVFLSLTQHWNTAHGFMPGHWEKKGGKKTESFPARKAVEISQLYSEREGDFEWGIGYHPYPKGIPWKEDWAKPAEMFSFDTPYITMMNLEVLDAFMKQDRYKFRGKKLRQIHLSEQGYQTKKGASEYEMQAAQHIYSIKKCDRLETMIGWEPVRWTDSGRWKIGFFTKHPTKKRMDSSGEAKPIVDIYPKMNTPEDATATDFAKKIIGISDWDEIMFKGEIK